MKSLIVEYREITKIPLVARVAIKRVILRLNVEREKVDIGMTVMAIRRYISAKCCVVILLARKREICPPTRMAKVFIRKRYEKWV